MMLHVGTGGLHRGCYRISRQEDNLYGRMGRFDTLGELDTVAIRQFDIAEHNSYIRLLVQFFQPCFAISRLKYFEAFQPDYTGKEGAELFLVVYD